MIFQINKGATLPLLKLELIKDGRNDYKKFHNLIQNSNIFFSMIDIETGIKKIGKKPALCLYKQPLTDTINDEYYIAYQFSEKETRTPGMYLGIFEIEFLDGSGKLIVPIREKLYIDILNTNN